ncbi:MAG: hypothetical protein U9Q99_02685, partial [Nanoarchaeota archaeon]|nr:hypothetical protein [Nanoarchaeota archaeon]
KNSFRSKYSFRKQQKVFSFLRKFLVKLGLENADAIGIYYNEENDNYTWDKEDKISEYNEKIENFSNKNYSVDIIYFSKTVELIINYKKDKQQIISNILEEFIEE